MRIHEFAKVLTEETGREVQSADILNILQKKRPDLKAQSSIDEDMMNFLRMKITGKPAVKVAGPASSAKTEDAVKPEKKAEKKAEPAKKASAKKAEPAKKAPAKKAEPAKKAAAPAKAAAPKAVAAKKEEPKKAEPAKKASPKAKAPAKKAAKK